MTNLQMLQNLAQKTGRAVMILPSGQVSTAGEGEEWQAITVAEIDAQATQHWGPAANDAQAKATAHA